MDNIMGLLLCFVQVACGYQLFDLFLQSRGKPRIHVVSVIVLCGLALYIVNLYNHFYLNTIFGIIMFCFLCRYFFDSRLYMYLMMAVFYLGLNGAIEFTTVFFAKIVTRLDVDKILELPHILVYIKSIILVELIAIIVILSIIFKNKKKKYTETWSLSFLMLLPATSLFVLYTFLELAYQTNIPDITAVGIPVFLLLTNMALTFTINDKMEKAHLKVQLEIAEEAQKLQDKMYKNNEVHLREVKGLIHDFNHHLNCIYNMKDDPAKIIEYIEESRSMLREHSVDINVNTGNKVLDTILIDKASECAAAGVELDISINCDSLDFLSLTDTCAIFANALENAVNATKELASEKYIRLEIKKTNSTYFISIRNSKCPNEVNAVNKRQDILSFHGYGKTNIERAVKKYNGHVIFNDFGNEYLVSIDL